MGPTSWFVSPPCFDNCQHGAGEWRGGGDGCKDEGTRCPGDPRSTPCLPGEEMAHRRCRRRGHRQRERHCQQLEQLIEDVSLRDDAGVSNWKLEEEIKGVSTTRQLQDPHHGGAGCEEGQQLYWDRPPKPAPGTLPFRPSGAGDEWSGDPNNRCRPAASVCFARIEAERVKPMITRPLS